MIVKLQRFTKYLRLTLVSCEAAHYGKSVISVFQELFASIDKIFILAGRLEFSRLWGLDTFLMFPNFLRSSEVLSRSATSEATRIYHAYK